MEETKPCFICGQERARSDFPNGANPICKYCAEDIDNRRKKIKHQKQQLRLEGYKLCRICLENKPPDAFDVLKKSSWPTCTDCETHLSSKRLPKHDEREKRIEQSFGKSLSGQGIFVQHQVRCKYGIADIVTPDAIYEIKAALTRGSMLKAIAQVLLYQKCINPSARAVIVGPPHNAQIIDIEMATSLGIEVIIVDDNDP